MANAVIVSFLVIFALQVSAGAAWRWPWASEACEQPGAVRDEPDGGASVCVVGEGWRYVAAPAWDDLRGASLRANPNCTDRPGETICDTICSAYGYCTDDGVWLSPGECDVGELCLNGECEEITDGMVCPSSIVKCATSGVYPNLEDCSKFYTCTAETGEVEAGECGTEDLVFDACSGTCDVELPATGECSWAVSNPCPQAGAVGVAPNNDRLYYICLIDSSGNLYQNWMKCTTGHFSLTSKACVNATEPGCGPLAGDNSTTSSPSDDTTTVEATTTTITTTTTTTTTTEAPVICTGAGVTANPSTTCSFYYCYADGSYMTVFCLNGYYFDPNYGGCTPGQCT